MKPKFLKLFVVGPNEIRVIKWAHDLDMNDDLSEAKNGTEI